MAVGRRLSLRGAGLSRGAHQRTCNGQKPREVDAFLHQCWRQGPKTLVDREDVYRQWLATELGRGGAARLPEARLVRFQRQRLARRDHAEARIARCERPDATFTGILEVTDVDAFAALLRRGLGRHRAFGFGMLLLSH